MKLFLASLVFLLCSYPASAGNNPPAAVADFVGGCLDNATSSCTWSISQTAYSADFGANASCTNQNAQAGTQTPTCNSTKPDIAFTNLPKGKYQIMAVIPAVISSSGNGDCALFDGSGTLLGGTIEQGNNSVTMGITLYGVANYTTTANRTFTFRCTSSGGTTTVYDNNAGVQAFTIHVFRMP